MITPLGKIKLSPKSLVEVHFQGHDRPDVLINFAQENLTSTYGEFYQNGTNPLRALRIFQYEKLIDRSIAYLNPGDSHLDVGCGDGLFIDAVQNRLKNIRSVGIDPYAPTSSNVIKRLTLTEMTANYQERNSDRFVLITLLDVFEHFVDSRKSLREIKTLLQPSGTILLKVPSKDSIIYSTLRFSSRIFPSLARVGLRILYQVNFPPPHYFFFNYASLDRLLQTENLEIVEHLYLSETTIPFLYKRLWNIKPIFKPFLFVALSLLEIFTPRTRRDCLAVWIKHKKPD